MMMMMIIIVIIIVIIIIIIIIIISSLVCYGYISPRVCSVVIATGIKANENPGIVECA